MRGVSSIWMRVFLEVVQPPTNDQRIDNLINWKEILVIAGGWIVGGTVMMKWNRSKWTLSSTIKRGSDIHSWLHGVALNGRAGKRHQCRMQSEIVFKFGLTKQANKCSHSHTDTPPHPPTEIDALKSQFIFLAIALNYFPIIVVLQAATL